MNSILENSFPTALAQLEWMRYTNIWHSIMAFMMILAIIAPNDIGSVGMERAFDAMGSGQVGLEWPATTTTFGQKRFRQGKGGSSCKP